MDTTGSKMEDNSGWIPEGFVEVLGPNGQRYLVPEFYAPALHISLDALEEKKKLVIEEAGGTVSYFYTIYFV
jgi:hypothetical protein